MFLATLYLTPLDPLVRHCCKRLVGHWSSARPFGSIDKFSIDKFRNYSLRIRSNYSLRIIANNMFAPTIGDEDELEDDFDVSDDTDLEDEFEVLSSDSDL